MNIDNDQREMLVKQILEYDKQIQAYIEEDAAKTPAELEKLSVAELKDWLLRRTTKLQFLIDEGIEINKNSCATKA